MSFSSCISTTLCCSIFLFIIVGIPLLVHFFSTRPINPTFSLDHASITGFNVTSDNYLTASFNVVIRGRSPNGKDMIEYSSIRVSIFKQKQNLGQDPSPAFSQPNRREMMIRAEAVALNVGLKTGPANDFGLESRLGYVDFDVFMSAQFSSKANLYVVCSHVVVNVTSNSVGAPAMAGAPSYYNEHFRSIECGVSVYRYQYEPSP